MGTRSDGGFLSVSEQHGLDVTIEPTTSLSVELYLIRTRGNRPLLYVAPRKLKACEATEGDHIRNFIRKMVRHRHKVIRWLGRVTRIAHHYYQKLEDRIDPMERMIKAINCPDQLNIQHSPGARPESAFRALVRWQQVKHLVWLLVDGSITLVVVMLAPVLVPVPGPNVFFYYPALRLASHYRAMTGARRALDPNLVRFHELPELAGLEENLRVARNKSDIGRATRGVEIEGLDKFLERMG